MKTRIGIYLGALAMAVWGFAACGDGDGDGAQTTITGNVVERTALLAPAPPPTGGGSGWLFGLVGTAWAQSGVEGIQVCLERCLDGVDGLGGCADTDPMNLCTRTDGAGVFTFRGGFGGDLCVRLTDEDDPGFRPQRCMAGVALGDTVRLRDMSCLDGDGVCDCDEIRDRDQDQDRDQTGM